jgi:hypothetical protein
MTIQAPANFDPRKVEIIRKRFSITQGETLIRYNGRRIEQYSDTPALCPDGNYRQRDETFWIGVAMREAVARGMVA